MKHTHTFVPLSVDFRFFPDGGTAMDKETSCFHGHDMHHGCSSEQVHYTKRDTGEYKDVVFSACHCGKTKEVQVKGKP